MKFIISGKNIAVTEGLKTAVEDKLGKLERYFTPETEISVTLSVEKDRQKIEVTIPVKGSIIRSEQVSNDMYVSIDLVPPYLTPMPYRGRTNAPYMIPYTLRAMADTLDLPIADVARGTRDTARAVYGL